MLKFHYSTCCNIAFGSLRQALAAVAVVAYACTGACIRGGLSSVLKCLSSRRLYRFCARSSSFSRMEAYYLPEAITRRRAWEMVDCRWPDRSPLAEAGPCRRLVGAIFAARIFFMLPAFSTAGWYSLANTRAILGQGGFRFAVDVSTTQSVNTRAVAGPGAFGKEVTIGESRA